MAFMSLQPFLKPIIQYAQAESFWDSSYHGQLTAGQEKVPQGLQWGLGCWSPYEGPVSPCCPLPPSLLISVLSSSLSLRAVFSHAQEEANYP